MKSIMALRWLLPALFILLPACEDKEDPYSGFSKLVVERKEARRLISEEKTGTKTAQKQKDRSKDADTAQGDTLSSTALYERRVEITDTASGLPIAKGVAYLNKQGKIVRIKILKD